MPGFQQRPLQKEEPKAVVCHFWTYAKAHLEQIADHNAAVVHAEHPEVGCGPACHSQAWTGLCYGKSLVDVRDVM